MERKLNLKNEIVELFILDMITLQQNNFNKDELLTHYKEKCIGDDIYTALYDYTFYGVISGDISFTKKVYKTLEQFM